jgi:hypothetical protein
MALGEYDYGFDARFLRIATCVLEKVVFLKIIFIAYGVWEQSEKAGGD